MDDRAFIFIAVGACINVLAGLAAGAAHAGPRRVDARHITAQDAAVQYACPAGMSGTGSELKYPSEPRAIAATGRARRRGDVLQVGRVQLRHVPWTDKTDGYEYRYAGRYAGLPIDIVRVVGYEYDGIELVDQVNGAHVETSTLPVASSDGRVFVNLFGFDDPKPGIKLYERHSRQWITHTISAREPCGVRWAGPRTFTFKELVGSRGARTTRPVTVWLKDGEWRRN